MARSDGEDAASVASVASGSVAPAAAPGGTGTGGAPAGEAGWAASELGPAGLKVRDSHPMPVNLPGLVHAQTRRGRDVSRGTAPDGIRPRWSRTRSAGGRGYGVPVTTVSRDASDLQALAGLAESLTPGALLTESESVAAYRFDYTADAGAGV